MTLAPYLWEKSPLTTLPSKDGRPCRSSSMRYPNRMPYVGEVTERAGRRSPPPVGLCYLGAHH
jgi:hypothetical protein